MEKQSDQELIKRAYEALLEIWEGGLGSYPASAHERLLDNLRERLESGEQRPVGWHHPDCEGACIACLIEREVAQAYGKQGVSYLLSHVADRLGPLDETSR